jgi:glycosyltransferase involved in cell wall biosynthesis
MQKLAIITPVFNDWASFWELVKALDLQAPRWNMRVDLIAVDDGSTQPRGPAPDSIKHLNTVSVLTLACNIGHQRALAVGVAHVNQLGEHDCVVIMDCDGEDRPEDIARLIEAHHRQPDAIIAAQRTQRSEGVTFSASYTVYKRVFRALTGRNIDFGNFCLVPAMHISRLAHMAELWNHLAGTIVRARTPLVRIETRRGQRYAGRSHMNTISLIVHGLSAMAVFSDLLFVRLLVAALVIGFLAILGTIVAIGIRVFSDLAIPGWATTAVGLLLIILVQGLNLSAMAAFMTLTNRSTVPFIPAINAGSYIRGVQRIWPHAQ